MKRSLLILIILLLSIIFLYDKKPVKENVKKKEEIHAIFFSYIEVNAYFKDKDKETIKNNINKIIKNTKKNNYNTLILQVRSFSDAIYKSDLFPLSTNISSNQTDPDVDILSYFLKVAHKNKIKVIAWINPYRISTIPDKSKVTEESPAFKYLDTETVKVLNNGIYFNPASYDTENLIVSGIEELIKNYKVDGILFDDYFYPASDIDTTFYNDYLKVNAYLSLEDYHLMIINKLIKRVYKTIKDYNKDILFGISPDGNIFNNYHKNYADVKKWGSSNKYVDFLMPQIYYGFTNSTKPYIDTVNEWNNLITSKSVKLYIALALYKSGKVDLYAKDGSLEWINNTDLLKKQIIIARNKTNYNGFAIFRYDNIFNKNLQNDNTIKEVISLHKLLNNSFIN